MNSLHFYTYNNYKHQLEHSVFVVEETAKCYKSAEYDQYGKRKSFPYSVACYVSKDVVDKNNQNLSVILSEANIDKAKDFLLAQLRFRHNKIWEELIMVDNSIKDIENWNVEEVDL